MVEQGDRTIDDAGHIRMFSGFRNWVDRLLPPRLARISERKLAIVKIRVWLGTQTSERRYGLEELVDAIAALLWPYFSHVLFSTLPSTPKRRECVLKVHEGS